MSNFSDLMKEDKNTLVKKINALRKELFVLKMQKAVSGLEKPHMYKVLKKDIARAMTCLKAKSESR